MSLHIYRYTLALALQSASGLPRAASEHGVTSKKGAVRISSYLMASQTRTWLSLHINAWLLWCVKLLCSFPRLSECVHLYTLWSGWLVNIIVNIGFRLYSKTVINHTHIVPTSLRLLWTGASPCQSAETCGRCELSSKRKVEDVELA